MLRYNRIPNAEFQRRMTLWETLEYKTQNILLLLFNMLRYRLGCEKILKRNTPKRLKKKSGSDGLNLVFLLW